MIAVKEASPKVLANREERFWRQVEKTDSCWNWTGRMGDDGYGRFRYYKLGHIDSAIMAHKWAYINLVGEYSEPQLDHLCRNKVCVNPAHLEPVTEKENTRRGLNGVLRQFCPMGHPWVLGSRCNVCREGRNSRHRALRAIVKEAKNRAVPH